MPDADPLYRDHDGPPTLSGALDRESRRRSFFGTLSAPLCWLGGGRPATLRYCPSEAGRLAGLGLAVLTTGVFAGAAATFAASFFLRKPAAQLWPVGVLWGITIGNIDRLLIMMSGTWRRLVVTIPLRLAIAIPVGLLIAEIILLQLFQPEERAIIATTQQTEIQQEIDHVEGFYQPQITADQGFISQLQQHLASREGQIEQNRFLAGCERGDVRCSTTHRLGCAQFCQHYTRLADQEQAALDLDKQKILDAIGAKRVEIGNLNTARLDEEKNVRDKLGAGDGLAAHKKALDQLQQQDPGVAQTVLLLRVSLIIVDLMPILVKTFFVVFGKSAYDEADEAVRTLESVDAHWLRKLAAFRKKKIDRRLDADDEVDEAAVDAEKERLIAEAEGQGSSSWSPSGKRRSPRQPTIQAVPLSQFADGARTHEGLAVPIQRPLTRLGWIGTGLLAALAALPLVAGQMFAGAWLAVIGVGLAAALGLYTRGFRRAPAWAQRATFGVGLAGFLVPLIAIALKV